jgi:hypothetical protein
MPRRTQHFLRSWAAPIARTRTARRMLFGVLALALFSVVSRPAHAAVPMCSSDGRSVIAPPMILPWRELKLEAGVPCQQPDNPLLRVMPEQRQKSPSSAPVSAPLRAMPARAIDVPPPAGVRERIEAAPTPTNFYLNNSIYRPPRA